MTAEIQWHAQYGASTLGETSESHHGYLLQAVCSRFEGVEMSQSHRLLDDELHVDGAG